MKTFLDWSAYQDAGMGDAYADIPKTGGDFAKAVSVCISSRQCETFNKGVMCPSYRASGKTDFSTGGRIRLLKAALNGELGEAPFSDPALAETMEHCVSCKGCKRECENAVDLTAIKVEYLAQRNAQEGLSLRSRLFAFLPHWLQRWPWLGRLAAWRNRSPRLARLGEKLLGIATAAQLPEPAAQAFSQRPADAANSERSVVLLVDSFTRYYEPDIADAAIEVLQAAGYSVIVAEPNEGAAARPLCCGRTFLTHGLVEQAQAEARRLLAALLPHVRAGRPIVGLEPSCLLSLRDEYKALGLGPEAVELAERAWLLEEFIAKENSAQRLQLDLAADARPVLVHGHCHQKAVGAMKPLRKVLKLVPDSQASLIEASCCGMAGSFGLEAEHYGSAQAMAELALLPALRADPSAPIIANGFSCRRQIRQHDGRTPLHLAQWLRDGLRRKSQN
jgi:Fe-S oxidoreductase